MQFSRLLCWLREKLFPEASKRIVLSNHFNQKIDFFGNFAHNNFWSVRHSLDCKFRLKSLKLSVRGQLNKSSVCNSSKQWCTLLLSTKFFPKFATKLLNNLKWKLKKQKNSFFSAKKLFSNNFEDYFWILEAIKLHLQLFQTVFFVISHSFSEKSVGIDLKSFRTPKIVC